MSEEFHNDLCRFASDKLGDLLKNKCFSFVEKVLRFEMINPSVKNNYALMIARRLENTRIIELIQRHPKYFET